MKIDREKLGFKENQDWYDVKILRNGAAVLVLLFMLGSGLIFQSFLNQDTASADEILPVSEVNPSFTVQQIGNARVLAAEEGVYPLEAFVDEDGKLRMEQKQVTLYEEYDTVWQEKNNLTELSFLHGAEDEADGWKLSEIWFGDLKNSKEASDFLVLSLLDGDISKVTLTNNPDHPNLSLSVNGQYLPDEDGTYTVCIHNGDVVRLIFEEQEAWNYMDVNFYDYDVTDGGYHRSADLKEKQETSGQNKESGDIYLNGLGQGIHVGDPDFGFGGELGFISDDAFLTNEMETINVRNYGADNEDVGLVKGLTSLDENGTLIFNERLNVPQLFDGDSVPGRTDYVNGEFSFGFQKMGFTSTLSSVESEWGTAAERLEELGTSFYPGDAMPSFGTDGHDPKWGKDAGSVLLGDAAFDETLATHNRFFGWQQIIDFTLSPGYMGPLFAFGTSDDDLWIYLSEVDENGQLIEGNAVPLIDLGGVHDRAGAYVDLWKVLTPISYEEEAQHYRLFVYGLDRDGLRSEFALSLGLPDAVWDESHGTGTLAVWASGRTGIDRTFTLTTGDLNRYEAVYEDGTSVYITPGEEFSIPDGGFAAIKGLTKGDAFLVKETGRAKTWAYAGDGFLEDKAASGIMDEAETVRFLSSDEVGTLTLSAEGNFDEAPMRLSFSVDEALTLQVFDERGQIWNDIATDESGVFTFSMKPGKTFTFYGLPNGLSAAIEPEDASLSITEIRLRNGQASGAKVSGKCPMEVVYVFE